MDKHVETSSEVWQAIAAVNFRLDRVIEQLASLGDQQKQFDVDFSERFADMANQLEVIGANTSSAAKPVTRSGGAEAAPHFTPQPPRSSPT